MKKRSGKSHLSPNTPPNTPPKRGIYSPREVDRWREAGEEEWQGEKTAEGERQNGLRKWRTPLRKREAVENKSHLSDAMNCSPFSRLG